MEFQIDNLPQAIQSTKKFLRRALPNHAEVFRQVEAEMRRRVDVIVSGRESGQAVIPIVQYADVASGAVSPQLIAKIKDRGACVIRGTFDQDRARAWDNEIAAYVEENGLDQKLANAAEDKYFGTLASAKPQIYGIYWSHPPVEARQSESLTRVRVFLNNLWQAESEGQRHPDPNQVPVYADRIRRHPPGSASLGLSPHVDGGSVERWLDENFRKVYRHVFSGNWREYNAYDAAYRPAGARSAVPSSLFDVSHFPGVDGTHSAGQGRRHTPTDSNRRIDGLCIASRSARRRPGRRPLRRPAWAGTLCESAVPQPLDRSFVLYPDYGAWRHRLLALRCRPRS